MLLLALFVLPILTALPVQGQLTINCPSNISISAANGQCSRNVSYSQPTTNASQTFTQSFTYTGNVQTFTVPSGVTSVDIRAYGGQGRANSSGMVQGGRGGYASGTLPVSGGNVLYVYVGNGGGQSISGGYNGGGNAGTSSCGQALAGGGGGASDVRLNSSAISQRRIVAGGGGGAGGNRVAGCGRGTGGGGGGGRYGGGGGAGWPFASTTLPQGGTQTAGGAGGTSTFTGAPGNNGAAGGFGFGGKGGNEVGGSQGGSANALTGGVGGNTTGSPGQYLENWTGQSGAGGSGYIGGVIGGSMSSGVNLGAGRVFIAYTAPIAPTQTGGLPSGASFPVGTTTNSFSVSSGGSTRTCSFTVTVVDTQDPAISCPSGTTVSLNSSCRAAVPNYASMTLNGDNCTASPTVTQSPAAGSTTTGSGTQTVTVTATDGSGNSASCTVTLTKVDGMAPSVTCPSTRTFNLNSNCQGSLPNYTGAANATDNCTSSPSLTQSPAAGSPANGVGSQTVTITATDASGNTDNCTFTVNRVDATAPTVNCPPDQTISLGASCQGVMPNYLTLTNASDACSSNPSITQSPPAGTMIAGITTVTMTATDAAGNPGTCTFQVNTIDPVAPTVTCPGNQTEVLNANCDVITPDFTSQATTTDNCAATPTLTQSPAPGAPVSGVGTGLVTITATDGSGNMGTCTFNMARVDQTAPNINCPTNVTLNLNASCQAALPDYAAQAGITDNCSSNPTVNQSPPPGGIGIGPGTQNITITATDAANNSSNCAFTVTRVDGTAPTVTCPGNQTIALNASCQGVMPNYLSQATATDNCTGNPTMVQTPAAGTAITNSGPQTVTISSTDNASNTGNCTFTVDAQDQTGPSITCPGNQVVALNAQCQAQVPNLASMATVSDNCSATPNVTQSPAPGTTISGTTNQTVTLTAVDASNNTDNCSLSISYQDQQDPTITCPGNQTLQLNANCRAPAPDFIPMVNASDNCTASPAVTQVPSAGTLLIGSGPHTITMTVTDPSTNTTNCTFTVSGTDQTAPVITCPVNQTLALDANCGVQLPNYAGLAMATDNCTSNPGKVQSPAVGTSFNGAQMISITVTTTDASNLQDSCSFMLNIEDQTGPALTCPGPDTVFTDQNCEALLPDYTSQTSNVDNCSTVQNLSQSPFGGVTLSGAGTTQSVVMSAMDGNGNTGTCTLTITLMDTTAPVFTDCPTEVIFTPTSFDCNPTVSWASPTATDACFAPTVTASHTSGSVFPFGTTPVTYTAVDSAGNTAVCAFDIIVTTPVVDGLIAISDTTPCGGDSVQLSVAASLSAYNWSNGATSSSTSVTTPGWYWVDLTDASQCTARDSVFVNFYTAPNPVAAVTGDSVCTTPFATYQWYLNGAPIPGETGQCIISTVSGNLSVQVTDANGCPGTSNVVMFVGREDGLDGPKVEVYPNPTRDLLNIRVGEPLLEAGVIRMYDIAGRIVLQRDFERLEGTESLNLQGLADGTYLLEILTPTFRERTKVLRIR